MTVDEAFQTEATFGYGLGTPSSVSGHLVVSGNLVYLCASATEQQKSILVIAPWLADRLSDEVEVTVGSMHLFSGQATIKGHLAQSGLGLVPLALHGVTEVSLAHGGHAIVLRA